VQQIERVAHADAVRLFHEPRNADYRALAARYRKVLVAGGAVLGIVRRRLVTAIGF
jgi:hypothetical protein